jgi:hypothetical protein
LRNFNKKVEIIIWEYFAYLAGLQCMRRWGALTRKKNWGSVIANSERALVGRTWSKTLNGFTLPPPPPPPLDRMQTILWKSWRISRRGCTSAQRDLQYFSLPSSVTGFFITFLFVFNKKFAYLKGLRHEMVLV